MTTDNGFSDLFTGTPIFFVMFGGVVFLMVISVFVFVIVRALRVWRSNQAAEKLTRTCKIVDKRTEVWGNVIKLRR